MVANFFSSPLSTIPANAYINLLQNLPPSGILWADRWNEMIINDYALQQYIVDWLSMELSIIYSHLILVFIIHYQIRRTQTMLYLHECKLEPQEIAEYIVDPENNSFLLEEAFHRSNFKNRNSFKDRFNNKYQYSYNDEYGKSLEEYDQNSSLSKKAEDFMKPIVPKRNNIKDE
ncbi:hypothetical protein N9U16_00015 [Prochlorococcus sp. AH-736-P10]|nr:hypothetical protein [Prochlorococcus sp. AH-736-P10]MDA9683032.1 hypothetical protein [Prochlorococcus sp. AH-736-P10]